MVKHYYALYYNSETNKIVGLSLHGREIQGFNGYELSNNSEFSS